METSKWILAIIVVAVICGGTVFGVRQYHRKQTIEALQSMIREGRAQADVTFAAVADKNSNRGATKAQGQQCLQSLQALMVRVTEMQDAPTIQSRYIELLRAEYNLVAHATDGPSPSIAAAVDRTGGIDRLSYQEFCEDARSDRDHMANVLTQLRDVIRLEKEFQSECQKEQLSCEAITVKYEKPLQAKFDSALYDRMLNSMPNCKEAGGLW